MNMRLARWSYSEIRYMARWGNKRANAYIRSKFIAHLTDIGLPPYRQIHAGEIIASQRKVIGFTYLNMSDSK